MGVNGANVPREDLISEVSRHKLIQVWKKYICGSEGLSWLPQQQVLQVSFLKGGVGRMYSCPYQPPHIWILLYEHMDAKSAYHITQRITLRLR